MLRTESMRPSGRGTSGRLAFGLVGALLVGGVVIRFVAPERVAWVQAAVIVFGSLIVQATPFVLIGALAAAAIEVFVPIGTLERLADLPKPFQLPAAAIAGMGFPICECGSVPVARRLISKGLVPSAAVTFMLAAPVLNPVVIASTFVAYRGRGALWTMVLGRFFLGLIVAIAVGWVLGRRGAGELLRAPAVADGRADEREAVTLGRPESPWRMFFVHLGSDFLFMGRFLLLGAAVAALIQTFLPQSLTQVVAGLPVINVVVMMGFAFVLSLCSESDAFIAASFVQFGPSGQLAFLVFGPMVDVKLVALYAGTFRPATVRAILVTVAVVTFAGALWLGVISG